MGDRPKMMHMNRLSIVFALGFLISSFSIWHLHTDIVLAQGEQVEKGYNPPVYNDPVDADNFDNTQPQNPDPEFMEEVEPGEYNQSDDATELNDNNY